MSDGLDVGATAEVEEHISEVQAEPVEKSIDDTLKDTLNAINERDTPDQGAQDTKEVKSGKVRDSSGKFAKSAEPEAVELASAPAEDTPTEVATDPLPNSWKKEASEAWAKADPVLRAEVLRREADIHKGIEQYRTAAEYAHSIDKEFTPYKQTLANLGMTPQAAVRELMAADAKLRYGNQQEKELYFAQLAQHYGIDLGTAAHTSANVDPRLYELHQRNQYLEQTFQQQQQQDQQRQEQALNSEIVQFASDPKNVHFETVKLHMAALLQAGQAKDLSDAYEQAIYANPVTRQAVLQQQTQAAREEAAKKAQQARAAAGVNLKSTPSMPGIPVVGSLEDSIRETYRRLQSN